QKIIQMGCRCCKMIQSYLFDPVQVPSPGFVNEVNNCKLEEDDTVRLKGTQNSEVEVPRNALHDGSLSNSESRGSTTGLPHQGPLPQ
ncbi:RIKEN cDNA 0610040J01, isoform CRA_d, partial [Mus musculus]